MLSIINKIFAKNYLEQKSLIRFIIIAITILIIWLMEYFIMEYPKTIYLGWYNIYVFLIRLIFNYIMNILLVFLITSVCGLFSK